MKKRIWLSNELAKCENEGEKVLCSRALATFFSFINFFHSFYLISISPFLPLFLLLSSNISPIFLLLLSCRLLRKEFSVLFWSSDCNIAWQCTTKFRVVSLAFMHGFYITQHMDQSNTQAVLCDCVLRSEHWEVGIYSLFLPGNKKVREQNTISTTVTLFCSAQYKYTWIKENICPEFITILLP
jgi:hypothetical protein